jgi:hypothetical protein
MKPLAQVAALISSLASAACWAENPQISSGEIFRIQNAQYVEGHIVGQPIEDAGPNPPPASENGLPDTSRPNTNQRIFNAGQVGASFTGDASPNAVSVAFALDGVSHGYWVVPVGATDPATGRLVWSISADFGRDIPPGLRNLRAVAIDKRGRSGQEVVLNLCIRSLVPDNLVSCGAKTEPPQAVISLSWDVNADLDLQVKGPDGRLLEPKKSTTIRLMDGGMPVPGPASFDHDSNANCQIDGFRVENLVWQTERPQGRYSIYANLFDACKQPVVHFSASVFEAGGGPDGGPQRLELKRTVRGELPDISANGGSQIGLFLTDYVFQ